MRIKILSVLLCAVIIFPVLLSSCKSYDEDAIISAAKTLIEKSYEVNEIYYGKGLPYTEDAIVGLPTEYAVVDSDCGYSTAEDIRELAASVYSTDYCAHLEELAFEGMSVDGVEEVTYARYIEDYAGRLTVRKDTSETGLTLNRTYDFSTAKVEKFMRDKATVSILSLVDGKEDETLEIELVFENDNWRLNTPTY